MYLGWARFTKMAWHSITKEMESKQLLLVTPTFVHGWGHVP